MTQVTNAQLKQIMVTNTATTNTNFQKVKIELNGLGGRISTLETTANNLDNVYVKQEAGKGLSEANFTAAEKAYLATLVNYDDTEVKADIAKKANAADVYTKTEIDGKLTAAMHFKGTVANVEALPANAATGDMYNILADGSNYAFDGEKWDKLSETLDLSVFYNKDEVDGLIEGVTGDITTHTGNGDIHVTKAQKEAWTAKQDALDEAQMLAVNSTITATKLAALETHVATADIHVTKAQKDAWTAKQDALNETQMLAVNSGIDADKVAKYEAYATNKVAANAAIEGATKCKITYDAKGLVTAGADLAEADIPALHLAKVTDVTATVAEVNQLAGAGVVKADLEKLHAITVTADQLNAVSEVNADDLEKLADVTATADELNVLDGITASTTELNYVKGVTSAIQTQLDGKQANLTDAQLLAVNSGIDATAKGNYDAHVANTTVHITAEERTAWNNKVTAQDVTDTINDIFGALTITAWDDIAIA